MLLAALDTPIKTDFSLTARPDHLRLYGSAYDLSVPACPTLFLRKQCHRFCTWETKLTFHPASAHAEAGTVLWWNYSTHSSIGIRLSPHTGTRVIRFRSATGGLLERRLSRAESDVVLIIQCGELYRFGFKELLDSNGEHGDSGVDWIGEVSNKIMTRAPLIGQPFAGMMLGLYSFGERQKCFAPADFSYAEFR